MSEPTASESDFNFRLAMLQEEVRYLHELIRHYDDLSFKLKGWGVTLWSGIVAFGAGTGIDVVVLASIPVSLTFWLVDGYFKRYQRRSMIRMGAIEQFMDSRGDFEGKGLREVLPTATPPRFRCMTP